MAGLEGRLCTQHDVDGSMTQTGAGKFISRVP